MFLVVRSYNGGKEALFGERGYTDLSEALNYIKEQYLQYIPTFCNYRITVIPGYGSHISGFFITTLSDDCVFSMRVVKE